MPGYTRLGTLLTQSWANNILTDIETLHSKQSGRGVLSGLVVTAGTGLAVNVSAGTMVGLRPCSLAGQTVVALPSVTRFLWVAESGATQWTTTTADLGSDWVCLGRVITSGSAVTSVANEGRTSLPRWTDLRTLRIGEDALVIDLVNGRVGVGTTPASTFDVAGAVRFGGSTIGFFGATPAAKTIVSSAGSMTTGATAFSSLPISAAYSEAEVEALRDTCQTLRDDVAALHTKLEQVRSALANVGLL